MFELALVCNFIWFSMAFYSFSLNNNEISKLLVSRKYRDSYLFQTISQACRFLGGMNFGFALLSILVLLNLSIFPDNNQRLIFTVVFTVAHASQFYFNVPVAIKNRKTGDGQWKVLDGTMLFIFITDFVMMILNGIVTLILLSSYA